MIKTKSVNNEINYIPHSEDYLERPRLYKLFKDAINYPLIIVCAGSGYGKTYAVHSFLKEYDAQAAHTQRKTTTSGSPAEERHTYTSWVQISERDNIPARFWESYSNQVSLLWPEFGARLKEIGFPKSDEAFSKYSAIKLEVASLPGIHIRVFDDFHLLRNTDILRFFERGVNVTPPNLKLILISRTMPEINLIGVMKSENVFTIQEDALCFTEEEIVKYFNQIRLSVMSADIRNIYDDTQGWAFAINLIAHSLAKKRKYERYALDAMKKNIFRFIEAEIPQTISEHLWRFLLCISLIDHLAAGLIKVLAKENCDSAACDSADELIIEMELLNAYIRYDFIMDSYVIHHLFLDYLRQKQEQILTDDERRRTYHTAGLWCEENGYHMDALSYYEKSTDYDAVIRKVTLLNLQMPQDTACYAHCSFLHHPVCGQIFPAHNLPYPEAFVNLTK